MARIIVVLAAASVLSAGYCTNPFFSDDSAFSMPDRDSWPGNALSEQQIKDAVQRFVLHYDACGHFSPWHWAMIGPGDYLLKGTNIRVVDAYNAPIPNVHVVRGYWGGDGLYPSVWMAKLDAEAMAVKMCTYRLSLAGDWNDP